MAEEPNKSPDSWNKSQVSDWLRSIGVKEQYIEKIYEEEVDGKILLSLDKNFLRTDISMKSGPAHFIIQQRDQLLQQKKNSKGNKQAEAGQKGNEPKKAQDTLKRTAQEQCGLTSKEDCRPRPFDQEANDFVYVKHRVLQPESGVFDLISPCHEYKSLLTASTLDHTKLQAKFAREVLKFAIGCMNIRSNGTIHFGVADSNESTAHTHGEIIGIPVQKKDIYVDALNHIDIKKCVPNNSDHVRGCVRPPRFVEVMGQEGTEKRYVVEVDVVPSLSIVKNKVHSVRLPNFKESTNKMEYEKLQTLRRVGASTMSVNEEELNTFWEQVGHRDTQREEAEKSLFLHMPESCQNPGGKLTTLMTSGKKLIEKDKWFILVTNKLKDEDLCDVDWLLNMNVFCVFDFDPDSKVSGLCKTFLQHHTANMHSLQTYQLSGDIRELTSQLHLFDQTSWIFCNGRSDFRGNDEPCDQQTWLKTKMTLLKESVSHICKQILPKGTFQVIFLLTSQVEKPLLYTFNEFYIDMGGHEDIICICEEQENFQKWKSFSEGLCGTQTVDNCSVVGMRMSHINSTLQQIQPVQACVRKHLPVFSKGTCDLKTPDEEQMDSLEILTVNHCEETSEDFIKEEKENIEKQFYHGGKVEWLNFWLAEQGFVGEVIERDAYQKVSDLLSDVLKSIPDQRPVNNINIFHHPGSGGSTVARQVLWDNRRSIRCAVIKPSYAVANVAEHAVQLREYDEKDPQRCLPVLLLIEDPDKEYLDDLRNQLEEAIYSKKVQNITCFILLSCRRLHEPEEKCRESSLTNVSVTHKLSDREKRKFSGKRKDLEEKYDPQFILTFVLLSQEFNEEYLRSFVENVLQKIDVNSVTTRLIRYVALLNTYVQGSFISQSHCEALLGLNIYMEEFRRHEFEQSLSPEVRLIFLHLRDEKTHINSVSIIHPLVAQEILQQLLGDQQTQSSLAMDLLHEKGLFEHRFGRHEYQTFLRELFIRRARISKGDIKNSAFAPLIEHVCEKENPESAIELLKEAFQCFHEDPFLAQTLARLHYTCDRFEQAEHWAEMATKKQPDNSFLLDTKGQVYKKWFQNKCKDLKEAKVKRTAENTADAVETALKAIESFHQCQEAAVADRNQVNNAGFFSEVETECSLLDMILSVDVFANKLHGRSKCMKYLLTEYIPPEVKDAWQPFHGRLKKLHRRMQEALEWISEELSYFQKDFDNDEEENLRFSEQKMSNPLKWLAEKTEAFGRYFSEARSFQPEDLQQLATAPLTPVQKRMKIFEFGGGIVTSILSMLKDKKAVPRLEAILSLYPNDPLRANFPQKDIVNYIFTHITLNCVSPQNPKVAHLKDLQALCSQLPSDDRKCSPGALFLKTLLFWPEDQDTDEEKERKYGIVQSAVEHLQNSYWTKEKDIPQRKRRIYTHFYLGRGNGLDKFVHKRRFEGVTAGLSMSEKRMKWVSGETWKNPKIVKVLKCVSGWTEDGNVYLEGPQKKKFRILPLHQPSVPSGNENITFYLGFTFRGPVACNIVKENK